MTRAAEERQQELRTKNPIPDNGSPADQCHELEILERELDLFFDRLPSLSGLLKVLTELPIQLVLESRDSGTRWLLDLSSEPMEIHKGTGSIEGTCALAGTANDLYHLLLGGLPFVQGFGERRLLLGGSMYHLVRFYCLLTLTPVLFTEHLFLSRARPGKIQTVLGGVFGWIITLLAGLVGRILRHAPREDRLYAIGALARGVSRCAPGIQILAPQKAPPSHHEHPLEPPKAPLGRRIWMGLFTAILSISGVKIGIFRYKLGLSFDLFKVLEKLSAKIQKPSSEESLHGASQGQ